MMVLSADRLRQVLSYDKATGLFTWLVSSGRCAKGTRAGSVMGNGYRRIKIDGVDYLEHRLAWLFVTGAWPKDEVDHDNTVRHDNRWSNLREATSSQNKMNSRARGRLGVKGVSVHTNGLYQAQIKIGGRTTPLGFYESVEEAHAAYVKAANDNFGEFARAA